MSNSNFAMNAEQLSKLKQILGEGLYEVLERSAAQQRKAQRAGVTPKAFSAKAEGDEPPVAAPAEPASTPDASSEPEPIIGNLTVPEFKSLMMEILSEAMGATEEMQADAPDAEKPDEEEEKAFAQAVASEVKAILTKSIADATAATETTHESRDAQIAALRASLKETQATLAQLTGETPERAKNGYAASAEGADMTDPAFQSIVAQVWQNLTNKGAPQVDMTAGPQGVLEAAKQVVENIEQRR
jgi:hypothetical protein